MGRSKSSSCLNIITCAGGNAADDDDDDRPHPAASSPESKVSSVKGRWSFRKRSPGPQVPCNIVISEPLSFNKQSSEVTANNNHSPKVSSASGNSFTKDASIGNASTKDAPNETSSSSPSISTSEVTANNNHSPKGNSFTKDAPMENTSIEDAPNEISSAPPILVTSEGATPLNSNRSSNIIDDNIRESLVVVMQAFIRGYLSRREFYKVKNVIKLQAAVRGHLVRRQAVGTLRCIQAIMKMQALIRAHQARLSSKKLDEHESEKTQKIHSSVILGKKNSCMGPDLTKSLLSNRFAHQLLESYPKTKPIYINCDPSKSDSSWQWLERWMAVALFEGLQEDKNSLGCKGQETSSEPLDYTVSNDFTLAETTAITPCESTVPAEDEMHLTTKEDWEQSPLESEATDITHAKNIEVKVHTETSDFAFSQIPMPTDAFLESVCDSISDQTETDGNLNNDDNTKASQKALADDGEEFLVGLKSLKLEMSASQSDSEDLIATTALSKTIDFSQDVAVDSRLDNSLFNNVNSSMTKELMSPESSLPHNSRVQLASSECGTEISISSTLDSPKRSEAEGGEIVLELGSLKTQKFDADGGGNISLNPENVVVESLPFNQEVPHSESVEDCDQSILSSTVACDEVKADEHSTEPTEYLRSQAENSNKQVNASSLERTPQSQTTASPLQDDPLNQNSVNAKRKKKNSIKSGGKLISQMHKKSPYISTKDSGGTSSTEYKQKDSKDAKRRYSMGITISDHIDQEPRVSTSNNTLPSYMQATESAKAKAHASISPKSNPDVSIKDNHLKKRHSLPMTNGNQGSPRIQRSTSQAYQSPKANGINSPCNSAERRWQK